MKEERLAAERARLHSMSAYELQYGEQLRREQSKSEIWIAGVDEVGRGPLAGPVVTAAVILDPQQEILFLNDSKKLSEKKREALFDEIMEKAVAVGVGIVSEQEIDRINILQATYEAMRQAIAALQPQPQVLLNDAVTIPQLPSSIIQVPIIKGDAKSISIAAASIIAKVTRDRMMADMDEVYPGYGFAKHKGYGTPAHKEAYHRLGLCPIHRRSFIHDMGAE